MESNTQAGLPAQSGPQSSGSTAAPRFRRAFSAGGAHSPSHSATNGPRPRVAGAHRSGPRGPSRGRPMRRTPGMMPGIVRDIKDEPRIPIPPIGDAIRIIPLGGVEEVGRNMTAIEYKDDIIIVDAGFQFKEDDTPGIDYILPNTNT